MRRAPTCRPIGALALVAVLLPLGVQAQTRIPGLTITAAGGYSQDGDLTPGLTTVNSTLEPGLVVGLQIEHYAGSGLLGFRIGGTYASRQLEDGSAEYGVIGLDLGGMVRPPLFGDAVRPFAALTFGAVMYQAASGSPPLGEGQFGRDPVIRGNITPTIGVDLSIIPQLGVRLEAGDRITMPSIGFSPSADGFPIAHTPLGLAGLQYRFGVSPRRAARRPEPAPRQPEPAPQPEPEAPETQAEPAVEPAPAPEPEPVTPEPEAPAGATFTVQVGTYLTPSTARRWGARLERRNIPVWYLDGELGGTPVSRVRAGATATRAQAQELAGIINASFGWETSVEAIGQDEPVPADAVSETREFLEQR
ncbi:MAG: SPOR domain-containing protein [Longimicrobiales bacterium]|nr:SPOR domain-containing protein [Longimicrobiales bacterium]